MIRFGKNHVAIITEVRKKEGRVSSIVYHHSTSDYGDESGVRRGEIIISKNNKPLELQNWKEALNGISWSKNDYLTAKKSERGIRRLKNRQVLIYQKNRLS